MTTATPNPTGPRTIASLDVSAEQVASGMADLVARQRRDEALRLWNATPERFAELAAHPVPADANHLAEYQHLVDADDPVFTSHDLSARATADDYAGWTPGGMS